jgi:hypothetical protein
MENNQSKLFQSAITVGVVMALLGTVLSYTNIYMTINQDPSGSPVDVKSIVVGIFSCLLAIAGGLAVVKVYLGQADDKKMKLGQGALLGVYTALVSTVASTIFSELWIMIDPEVYVNFMDAQLRNMESMPGISEEMLNMMEDNLSGTLTLAGRLKSLIWAVPIGVILYALFAMLGVKFFAEQPDEI